MDQAVKNIKIKIKIKISIYIDDTLRRHLARALPVGLFCGNDWKRLETTGNDLKRPETMETTGNDWKREVVFVNYFKHFKFFSLIST